MQHTVINLLRGAAKQFPTAPYLSEKSNQGWHTLSFQQVLEKSQFFAAALVEHGFQFNDKIALLAEGRNDWVITEYGLLMAGCVNVPLSIKLLNEEIQFRLSHAGCRGMIVSSNTIVKALESIDKETLSDFRLIYLDQNIEVYKQILLESGLDPSQVLLLSDLYALGEEKLLKDRSLLLERESKITEDQIVTISYTSGTTGNPKGIMLSHLNYYANSTDAMQFFDVSQGDRLLIILPLDHSFAHTVGIYASVVKGLSIYFVDARGSSKNAIKNIPINLKEANPHFLLTVPALTGNFMSKMKDGVTAKGGLILKLFKAGLQAGIEMKGNGFEAPKKVGLQKKFIYWLAYNLIFKKLQGVFGNSIRFCVGGGALLDLSQQQFFAAIGVPVYQGYGLTEATPIISANTPGAFKLGTSGKVIPNVECKIIDDKGNVLPQGSKGQIVIRGNNVMMGYYLNEEATEKSVQNDWLFTGDLGYFDKDDFLVVVGREKALLIAPNGEKYSPEGIEEAIVNTAQYIQQVMVYNDMKPYTVAVVSIAEDKMKRLVAQQQLKTPDEILGLIEKDIHRFKGHEAYMNQFPETWIPKHFVIANELFTEQNLMINSTLKMVRHKVLENHKIAVDALYTPEGARNNNSHNLKIVENYLQNGRAK